ncbi:MAG: hypothetical protein RLZZ262_1014 [Bacteroidota bacterium]|jgi:hypothetical protein
MNVLKARRLIDAIVLVILNSYQQGLKFMSLVFSENSSVKKNQQWHLLTAFRLLSPPHIGITDGA